jgi:hypothetical protein
MDLFMVLRLVSSSSPHSTITYVTYDSHPTVPAHHPWTPSTHALWSVPAQHSVHLAAAMLWMVRTQARLMYVPYELVELILKHSM